MVAIQPAPTTLQNVLYLGFEHLHQVTLLHVFHHQGVVPFFYDDAQELHHPTVLQSVHHLSLFKERLIVPVGGKDAKLSGAELAPCPSAPRNVCISAPVRCHISHASITFGTILISFRYRPLALQSREASLSFLYTSFLVTGSGYSRHVNQ